MRVLWLCNIMLPAIARHLNCEYSVREGWLTGTLERLVKEGKESNINLGICFPMADKNAAYHEVVSFNGFLVECYGFSENLRKPEQYNRHLESRFHAILKEFRPDLVHIFGTEFPHTLAMAKCFARPDRLLVGMQGAIGECAKQYLAGLPKSVTERNTFRDIVKRDGILRQQKKFMIRGGYEQKALMLTGNVTGRTDFDREFMTRLNPKVRYYAMNETMRSCFYFDKWNLSDCKKHRIFFSQADYPLKGFHILLGALQKIIDRYPDVEVFVAGNSIVKKETLKEKIKISSYGEYLRSMMKDGGLEERIHFLGSLSAEEMKEQYLLCHTYVCASVLENSPNSVAEAMLLGVPVVSSKTGGIPSMMEDGKEGLFFENQDSNGLSDRILEVWGSDALCRSLSEHAGKRAKQTHDPQKNYERLLAIYCSIKGV